MKRLCLLILSLGCAVILSACATVRMNNITETSGFSPDEDERRLWSRAEEVEELIGRSGLLYEDEELTAYLQGIADGLLPEEVKAQGLSVTVRVIADPAFNAFILPNGAMYVHTGLLANMDSEAQIATIIAHELVHFTNRHSLRQFRSIINKAAFFSTLSTIGGALAAGSGAGSLVGLMAGTGLLATVTGYSRELETEADVVGFSLVASRYDLSESVKAFENLEREINEREEKQPYFFSAHPHVRERIENFRRLCRGFREKEGVAAGTLVNEELYRGYTDKLLLDNAALDIRNSYYKSAERELRRFLEKAPEDARGYYYLGEMYLGRGEEGDKEKAIENYQRAISLDGSFPLPHRALGRVYYKDEKNREALAEFESYLALNPQAEDAGYIEDYIRRLQEKTGEEK